MSIFASFVTFTMFAQAKQGFSSNRFLNQPKQGTIGSCSEQAGCIRFTKKVVDGASCSISGNCLYQVCLTFDLTRTGCVKTFGDTISHVCDRATGNGCPRSDGGFDPDGSGTCSNMYWPPYSQSKCSAPDGYQMCQIGAPGETLDFLLKDGDDSNDEYIAYTQANSTGSPFFADPNSSCDRLSCTNANQYDNCGGDTQALWAKERIWKYALGTTCNNCGGQPDPSPALAPQPDPNQTPAPAPQPDPNQTPAPAPQAESMARKKAARKANGFREGKVVKRKTKKYGFQGGKIPTKGSFAGTKGSKGGASGGKAAPAERKRRLLRGQHSSY